MDPMDFKKTVDQVEEAVEDLEEKAEATIKEATNTPDKDHENIPDAREGLTEKAKTLAGQVQYKAKLGEVKGDAEKVLDSARTGISDKDSKKG
jgi:vacuolar-type H+-ATPase subunit H